MDEKMKELIAIGASATAHCQPCLMYHIEQAIKNGASPEEIAAATEVGKTVEKGALKAMDDFAKEQIESLNSTHKASSGNGCGCTNSSCCSA